MQPKLSIKFYFHPKMIDRLEAAPLLIVTTMAFKHAIEKQQSSRIRHFLKQASIEGENWGLRDNKQKLRVIQPSPPRVSAVLTSAFWMIKNWPPNKDPGQV